MLKLNSILRLGPAGALLMMYFITWFPAKGAWQVLQYGLPILLLLLSIPYRRITIYGKIFILVCIFFFIGSTSVFYSDTGFLNYILSILTYSGLFVFAIQLDISKIEYKDFICWIAYLSILEFVVGFTQFFLANGGINFSAADSGDSFKGTVFAANSHLFSIKSLFAFVFLIYQKEKTPTIYLGIFFSFISAVYSSFLMGLLLILLVLITVEIWNLRGEKKIRVFVYLLLVTVFVMVFWFTQSDNVRIISIAFSQIIQMDFSDALRFQKILVFYESIKDVLFSDFQTFLTGTGIGRFSNRAAMILSGGYLDVGTASIVPISRSELTYEYIYLNWNPDIWSKFGGSVMGLPTSSLQAILIESGLLGSMVFIGLFLTIKRKITGNNMLIQRGQKALLYSLLIICISDLWLEYPSLIVQIAIFLSFNVTSKNKSENSSSSQLL